MCRERRGTALPSPARRGCPTGVDWSNRCAPAPPLLFPPRRGAGGRAGGAAVGRACDWPAWTGPGGQGSPGAEAPGHRRRRRGACRSALLPAPPSAWPRGARSAWLELRKLSGRVATPRPHYLVTLALGRLGSLWDGVAQRPRWRVEVRARCPESSWGGGMGGSEACSGPRGIQDLKGPRGPDRRYGDTPQTSGLRLCFTPPSSTLQTSMPQGLPPGAFFL